MGAFDARVSGAGSIEDQGGKTLFAIPRKACRRFPLDDGAPAATSIAGGKCEAADSLCRFNGCGVKDIAASPTCAASCLPQAQKRACRARTAGGLERSDRIKCPRPPRELPSWPKRYPDISAEGFLVLRPAPCGRLCLCNGLRPSSKQIPARLRYWDTSARFRHKAFPRPPTSSA